MKNTLRIWRAIKRLPQWRVAQRARIGANRYWRIENDHAEPTEQEMTKLAAVLGAPVAEVFPPKPAPTSHEVRL